MKSSIFDPLRVRYVTLTDTESHNFFLHPGIVGQKGNFMRVNTNHAAAGVPKAKGT